jgi:hypothetical protein
VERVEQLLVDLRDELVDSVHPLEERVVALAEQVERLHLPVPVPVERPAVDPATAALVASAASAMARLEARIEAEFASIHRQLDAIRDELSDRPRRRRFLRSA